MRTTPILIGTALCLWLSSLVLLMDKLELYDMEADRTETRDLSPIYPEVRQQMIRAWTRMAAETQALPWPDRSKAVAAPFDR